MALPKGGSFRTSPARALIQPSSGSRGTGRTRLSEIELNRHEVPNRVECMELQLPEAVR